MLLLLLLYLNYLQILGNWSIDSWFAGKTKLKSCRFTLTGPKVIVAFKFQPLPGQRDNQQQQQQQPPQQPNNNNKKRSCNHLWTYEGDLCAFLRDPHPLGGQAKVKRFIYSLKYLTFIRFNSNSAGNGRKFEPIKTQLG